jgi:hypothetical protein
LKTFVLHKSERHRAEPLSYKMIYLSGFTEASIMKPLIVLAGTAALIVSTSAADAKGCIKGAILGGVAGHYAGGHRVVGAAAGCYYGRHRAKQQARQQQGQPQSPSNSQGKI